MISMSMDSAVSGTSLAALFLHPPNEGGVPAGRAASLTSHIGRRSENQDRAFVALMSPRPGEARFVAAVLDGLGGMEDGAAAASLAAGSFIQSVATSFTVDLDVALAMAMAEANVVVRATLQGRGGTTLTAVGMSSAGQCFVVHVGDSRLYTASPCRQITTDDSPRGLYGSDLGFPAGGIVQFVGMGDRVLFQSIDLSSDAGDSLLLTTDGFHGAEGADLSTLLDGPDAGTGAALERFGRGLSPGDNATAILISRRRVMADLARLTEGVLTVTSTTERRGG